MFDFKHFENLSEKKYKINFKKFNPVIYNTSFLTSNGRRK